MPHGSKDHTQGSPAPDAATCSCARCGRPIPVTRAGRVKRGSRYCSARCRTSEVRDRRAQARLDLLAAIEELRVVEGRVAEALAVLGLNPMGSRCRRG